MTMMSLGLIMDPYGNHPVAWRLANAPNGAETSIEHYSHVARTAEESAFDFIFFADTPAVRDGNIDAVSRWPLYAAQFEPLTLLGALAGATTKIGLAATVSTSFSEPYNVARQLLSLDHLSHGRIAWNVVTTSQPAASFNFGREPRKDHGERYARAREHLEVVKGLWRSWDDDAFLYDRDGGRFFDPDKLHRLNFEGQHFSVRGPLNVPRSPQGNPVIIQAGASEAGKELAAETAEVVFTADRNIDRAREFYTDLKGRMTKFGRGPNELRILSGLNPIFGRTRQEAQDLHGKLCEAIHPDVGRELLSIDMDYVSLKDVPLDEPLPADLFPKDVQGGKSYLSYIRQTMNDRDLTLRQLYESYATGRGGNVVVGSPEDVVDLMEEWFTTGAADGFMIGFSLLPQGIEEFGKLIVPELRRRGLFRETYTGGTLREHLGLSIPR
ncbi:putative monooxygenase YxeK [Mesorhizobium sp. L-8-10]|uniref:LLM class flavin-dependent oxidoreductase n=1 Tax=Mesorhizobium sp. L-8-10 TaxID=2744523 RepID=UPI0019282308|nr:LLM class flavin-dependent oxidoreductase [Mesorhizobium sp. L-8-10]BCH29900.1 putative monooxygenase YxeK [Mesorhizobium sp. L-8-10]